MPRIPEYTAPRTELRPSGAGFAAFETAGRRVGFQYSQAGQRLAEAGRIQAQILADRAQWPFTLLALQEKLSQGGGGGGINVRVAPSPRQPIPVSPLQPGANPPQEEGDGGDFTSSSGRLISILSGMVPQTFDSSLGGATFDSNGLAEQNVYSSNYSPDAFASQPTSLGPPSVFGPSGEFNPSGLPVAPEEPGLVAPEAPGAVGPLNEGGGGVIPTPPIAGGAPESVM